MRMFSDLPRTLGIRPEERKPVWFAFFVFFWGGTGRALASSASYSAFLTQFGGDFIPYIYILTGAFMAAVMTLYLRLSARRSLVQMLLANFLLMTSLMFGFALWLALRPSPVVVFILPVWFESFCVMLPLALWALAGQIFTVRQGKRLFGIVGSGLPLGFMVGGLLTRMIAPRFGSSALLLAAAICLLLATVLAVTAVRLFPGRFAATKVERRPAYRTGTASLWRSRYVLLIFGILTGWTLAFFLVDYTFLDQIGVRFPTESATAAFMGLYAMLRGLLMLLGGMLLSGRLLERFGVRIGVLALPAVLVLSSLVLIVPGAIWGVIPFLFWPAVATKLLHSTFDTVDRSALSVLYQPLATNVRVRVQTAAEGILRPVMTGVAGVLLLVMTNVLGFTVVQSGGALLMVLVGWIIVALAAGREYPALLMAAIMHRRLDSAAAPLHDESSRLVLQQALHSPHADVAIYALNQLAETDPTALAPAWAALLNHPLPAVRQEALARLERSPDPGAAPLVEHRLAVETDAGVRGALLRTALAVDAQRFFATAVAELTDSQPCVRRGAAAGLLRYAGTDGVLVAEPQVLGWVAAPAACARITGAFTLGDAGSAYAQPLCTLLHDPDPVVRCAALDAAGRMRAPQLWPAVVAALAAPATAPAAATALLAGGDDILPALAALWQPAETPKPQQLRLAHLCARIRTPTATALLATHITAQDAEVRGAVLQALQRCGYKADAAALSTIGALVEQEGAAAIWVSAAWVALGADNGAVRRLRAALEIEISAQRARVLHLVACATDAQAVHRAHEILHAPQPTPDQRAYAQEILDLVTPQALKGVVLTLVDDLDPPERLLRLQSHLPQYAPTPVLCPRDLVSAPPGRLNNWTVACALAALQLDDAADHAVAVAATTAPDPLVRATAAWLLRRSATSAPAPDQPGAGSLPQEHTMLSTIERVIILKHAGIFSAVPDNLLVAVAASVEEVTLQAGAALFAKGDFGDAMYFIVSGGVRIHDGAHTLNQLGAYEVFGEMALFDAAPRSASATATEETLLLCLRQEEFFELLEDHGAIARGIILVLSQRLRARSEELAQVRTG